MKLLERLLGEPRPDESLCWCMEKALVYAAGPEELDHLVDLLGTLEDLGVGRSVLLARGTPEHGQQLWSTWKKIPEGGLCLLARLGVEEAGEIAIRTLERADWSAQCDAVSALLQLDCRPWETKLRRELDRFEGQPLFPELLPALAPRVLWPELEHRLLAWEKTCSVDCMGGIILGLALGNQGDAYERLLHSPEREFDGSATGNRRWSWLGGRLLKRGTEWLIQRIRQGPEKQRTHLFRVLLGWVDLRLQWISDEIPATPPATLEAIHGKAFTWGEDPNEDGSLSSLCPEELTREYQEVKRRVEEGLAFEVLAQTLGTVLPA